MLLKYGANPNLSGRDGQTPISVATKNDKWSSVEVLIKHGVPIDTLHGDWRTRVQSAIKNDHCALEECEEILHYAITNRNHGLANLLLQHGVDPNKQGLMGRTPLIRAVIKDDITIFRPLTESRIDLNKQDLDDRTALIHAVIKGDIAAFHSLIQFEEANVNIRDTDRRTTLSHAILNRNVEMVYQLLLSGASTDLKDETGRTPFLIAVQCRDTEILNLLLSAGKNMSDFSADKNLSDLEFQDDLDHLLKHAACNGNRGVVKALLVSYKIIPDLPDANGRTLLSHAAVTEHIAVVRLLLASGEVDINRKDKWGFTPLSRAVQQGTAEVIEALLETGQADARDKDSLL